MKQIIIYLSIISLILGGCATAHRKLNDTAAVYGPPVWNCTINNGCDLVQNMEVPGAKPGSTTQLTSVGCGIHTIVTFGHIAWECRKETTMRGRWLWHKAKDPHIDSWTNEDWKLSARYYGKPYLKPPTGWHWVCINMPKERCYIDKNQK